MEAAELQQAAELGLGPLAGAAEEQEHVNVHADRRRTVVCPLRQDGLDQQQAEMRLRATEMDSLPP